MKGARMGRREVLAAVLGAGVVVVIGASRQPAGSPPESRGPSASETPGAKSDAPPYTREQVQTEMLRRAKQIELSSIGRYQICMSTVLARSSFLLDTATGRCWALIEDIDTKHLFWKEMDRYSEEYPFEIIRPSPKEAGK